ncbi:peptidoglycan editing factor PgeF [Nocardioides sp. BP30]|uniref:peptidoglycan editing factor PgeF n=1 Tax=Nocardioides sp. BP30 TaxID=3036374 RepID=UPI0024697FF3|nr:peptidoglycan editing factor PgeF [Nocardioides sp. BP30]WGL53863.1 peptidoglycan editing factor PgeF [Nocardioides sp. BP30]
MFAFRDTCDLGPGSSRVEVAFTDASLDLQGLRDGFPDALARIVEVAGVPFARLHQVHGDAVLEVVDADVPAPRAATPVADALVTGRHDVGLMIRVADCVPVVLADPAAGVIGAVHAGRKGVALDVVGRTVERMRHLGASELRAWIGPHVCGRCYEVPEELRAEVAAVVPATFAETSWHTPSLDLGAGVRHQLAAAGIDGERVRSVERCTLEDERLHSHRRDGERSGRLAGLVWFG